MAGALEELFADRRDEYFGLLAYHYEAAGEAGQAIDYLLRAGDQARLGDALPEARDFYQRAVAFTGKVVGLVGVTLAAGVVTWAWSPIKFQADMGILLTFMFVWNMLGALILIPALSHFLLRGESSPRLASGQEGEGAGVETKVEVLERRISDEPWHGERRTTSVADGGPRPANVYP